MLPSLSALRFSHSPWRSLAALSLALLAACGPDSQPAPAKPTAVGVVTLQTTTLPVYTDLPGRTAAFREAEVRARVDGIVLERRFKEGGRVKAGELLYRIDPSPYRAALAGARADLAKASANLGALRDRVRRYETLAAAHAISQQELDDASAALGQAEAEVAAGHAAVDKAEIDLAYTEVRAPIGGYVGLSLVTEGAYVQASQATLMATVQQIDPIYVDISQSSDALLALRRDLKSGRLQRGADEETTVQLRFDDGTEYPLPGRLTASNITVEPDTGAVRIRAEFPNPDGSLLPGLFVRARVDEGENPNAILIPQIAVSHNPRGEATVMRVGQGNAVERVSVSTTRTVGDQWLVTAGLKSGDRVVVSGLQKIKPGDQVTPEAVPATATAEQAPAVPAPELVRGGS